MKPDSEHEIAPRSRTLSVIDATLSAKDRLVSVAKTLYRMGTGWIRDLIDSASGRKPASISYRFLAHQIADKFEGSESRPCIVFSAADSGGLGSDTSLMVALFLHEELGSKVLLVDGSFTAGGITERVGLTAEAGLSEYLDDPGRDLSDYIKPTASSGVFVLPAGRASHKITRPPGGQAVRSILDELTQFDYILIQQGSIAEDTRYLAFAQSADLVLLYCEEGATLVSNYEASRNILREYEIQNVGVILLEAGG